MTKLTPQQERIAELNRCVEDVRRLTLTLHRLAAPRAYVSASNTLREIHAEIGESERETALAQGGCVVTDPVEHALAVGDRVLIYLRKLCPTLDLAHDLHVALDGLECYAREKMLAGTVPRPRSDIKE